MARSKTMDRVRSGVRERVFVVFGLVATFWIVWAIDHFAFDGGLRRYGILPREKIGLRGIVFAPFLHGDLWHLISNTVPFAILGLLVAMRDAGEFVAVTAIVSLVSGLGTWVLGNPGTVHIGASGLVFGYFGFLVARGLFDRSLFSFLVAVAVGVLYGGMIWGLIPFRMQPGISWEGHLCGAVGGVLSAWMFRRSAR